MTGSVSKQILKNKLKEKSQAEDEFSTETKELVEQRASVEGSTMTKVGQTSSGFTAMSSSVGNKPVFDGPVAAVMNEPVDGLRKEPSDASKLSAITGTNNTGANLTEVVAQANVKGMDVALREKAGVSNTEVASIVTDASPIKDKVEKSVPLVQTGGIEEEAGKKAASVTHPTERRKFSIPELRRICGFPDDFILTGKFEQQPKRLARSWEMGLDLVMHLEAYPMVLGIFCLSYWHKHLAILP